MIDFVLLGVIIGSVVGCCAIIGYFVGRDVSKADVELPLCCGDVSMLEEILPDKVEVIEPVSFEVATCEEVKVECR